MIDGIHWEQFIISSFCQLTHFQFKFQISRQKDDNDIINKFKEYFGKKNIDGS